MKTEFKKIKREAMPFLIAFIVFDIVVIGSICYAISNIPKGSNSGESVVYVVQNFLPSMTGLKFFKGMFVDFLGFLYASFWTLIVFAIMFLLWKVKFSKTHKYDGIESGSSQWSKHGEEFEKTSDGKEILNKKNGFILSKEHYLGTDLKKVLINKNILVVGGSGAGKSACYIKPNILQLLGSYVITDPKGELYRETSGFLKANGYNVRVLNLVNPEYSDRYNPLAHIIDHTSVDIIAHTIVVGATKGQPTNDPFWDNTAKMLLKACIYYVISVLPEEEQNLSSCLSIIRQGGSDETLFDKLFIDELKPEHPGRIQYENFKTAADKTMQSIIISTISKVETFDTPSMQRITTSNNIDFEELGNRKTALYVITSAADSTYDFVSTIFFSQMLQKLYAQADNNGGTLRNQVYFLLDEFANIGQIPDFNKKLSTTRSLGISISIVVQSLDQLEALYKDNYENIMGNCDTKVFLGSSSIKTCEYFQKSMGQTTIKFMSRSVSKDKNELTKQGVSVSEQRQGRDLMTIDEIMRLDPNEELLIVRTLKPIRTKKAWYFKYHPMRDEAAKYEIKDMSQMPKTDDVPICVMDVRAHIEKREKMVRDRINSISNNKDTNDLYQLMDDSANTQKDSNKSVANDNPNPDFDLQAELEKKFDELFGNDNKH